MNEDNNNSNEKDSGANFTTRYQYRYLIEPNQQIMAVNEELNLIKNVIKKLFKKCQELKVKNQELIQINFVSLQFLIFLFILVSF